MSGVDLIAAERERQVSQEAKDAEIETLISEVAGWKEAALTLGLHPDGNAVWRNARAEAAERERDSLREANARLAADLDAALKAGKDGQQ